MKCSGEQNCTFKCRTPSVCTAPKQGPPYTDMYLHVFRELGLGDDKVFCLFTNFIYYN